MSYSAFGRRPFEAASKSSHHHIINDPEVQKLISQLFKSPREAAEIPKEIVKLEAEIKNPVEKIIAVDGGYTEAQIEKDFPSRLIHFLQFGALYFTVADLLSVETSAFIAPEDIAKLKNIQRLKLALPTKGVRLESQDSLKHSVLRIVYDFFNNNTMEESSTLLETLRWFIFKHYKDSRSVEDTEFPLATNPWSNDRNSITLKESEMDSQFTFPCPETGNRIYLTDVFRFHEVIDEEQGAGGILGYLVNTIEQFIIIHIIRLILKHQPEMLSKVMFIKDGPLGFFGQTARMHKWMLELINWLLDNHNIYLAGLEKSGAFVEYAHAIQSKMEPNSAHLLSTKYIYTHITPGDTTSEKPYAETSYFGQKLILKTANSQMYVVTIPVRKLSAEPTLQDIPNLKIILSNIASLRCDMYESALFPIALVNKLVSLSAHPSQRILQKFASSSIS